MDNLKWCKVSYLIVAFPAQWEKIDRVRQKSHFLLLSQNFRNCWNESLINSKRVSCLLKSFVHRNWGNLKISNKDILMRCHKKGLFKIMILEKIFGLSSIIKRDTGSTRSQTLLILPWKKFQKKFRNRYSINLIVIDCI